MHAKALSLRNMNEPNPLVAVLREAEHAVVVAEAISLGLTISEVTGRPGQKDGEVLVGCEIGGTPEQLVDMFRGLTGTGPASSTATWTRARSGRR